MYPTTADVLACQASETLCWTVATPFPLAARVAVFEALVVNPTDADVLPLACGEKVRVNVALWPAASVAGRDKPETLNSELLDEAEEIVTLAALAVSVLVRLLDVPTFTFPKLRLEGFTVSWPLAAPVPLSAMARLELGAFDEIVSEPLVVPAEAGANRTVKVRLCPAVS